jgi:hypothetical protein
MYAFMLCGWRVHEEGSVGMPGGGSYSTCYNLRRSLSNMFRAPPPRKFIPLAADTSFEVANASRLPNGRIPDFVATYLSYPDSYSGCKSTLITQPLTVYLQPQDVNNAHSILEIPEMDISQLKCDEAEIATRYGWKVSCVLSYANKGKADLALGDPHPAVQAYRHSPLFQGYRNPAADVLRDLREPGVGHPRVIYYSGNKRPQLACYSDARDWNGRYI